MSATPMRRVERVMSADEALAMIERGHTGRLATIGPDGYPYCVPLLYIWADNQLLLHGTAARSHWQSNIRNEAKACFEIDEPGEVFDYGRFECDSGISFQSIIMFGEVRIAEDVAIKQQFYERLMEKYGKPNSIRPKNFFPRLDVTNVYAMTVERITGKQANLPDVSEQWPAKDRTATPNAKPARV